MTRINSLQTTAMAVLIFALFILCGCKESPDIWERYCTKNFSAVLRYYPEDTVVCADIKVSREEEGSVLVRFALPDMLQGLTISAREASFRADYEGMSVYDAPAKELARIPLALAGAEAISRRVINEKDESLLSVSTKHGTILFDMNSGKPVRAEIMGIECEFISFFYRDPT